jgi:hypothetical protein
MVLGFSWLAEKVMKKEGARYQVNCCQGVLKVTTNSQD